MAAFWSTGVEAGNLGVGGNNSALFVGVGPNTTVVPNPITRPGGLGQYCVKVAPAGGLAYVQNITQVNWAIVRQRCVRFYFMPTVYPTSKSPFFEYGCGVNGSAFGPKLWFDGTGVEFRFGNTGQLQTVTYNGANTVFALNTWYCIDLYIDTSTTQKHCKLQINSIPQVSAYTGTTEFLGPTGDTAVDLNYTTFGSGDSVTYTAYYDDFAASDLLSDYPLGQTPGSVLLAPSALSAASAGTSFSYYPSGGPLTVLSTSNQPAALATIQDARPYTSVADYIQQTKAGTSVSIDVTFAGPAANVVGANIVRIITDIAGSTASATSINANGVVGATTTTLYSAFATSSTSIAAVGRTLTVPAGGWTAANLATIHLTWGLASSITVKPLLHQAYVEYEPILLTTVRRRVGKYVF